MCYIVNMSHATGLILFEDGCHRFFEYDGTVDVCRPKLWETYQELHDHWREELSYPWAKCTCGNPPESVKAFADYGNGMHWNTTACKTCGLIVDRGDPYTKGMTNGKPTWVKLILDKI